jgi:ubiquinone biosynthesis protein Coq4
MTILTNLVTESIWFLSAFNREYGVMSKWRQFTEVMRARRENAPLADIAVMKFAWYVDEKSALNEQLRGLDEVCLEVDMEALRRLPEGTVGRVYAQHLDGHGLQPMKVSPEVQRRYADNPLPLRYTTTHDLFHVLTGFPTTPAGELGLFAFMVGQGFATRAWLRQAEVVYAILMPLHMVGVRRNVRAGLAMAGRAAPLLAQPMRPLLDQPLAQVRRQLNIPSPEEAGIHPGHESLLSRWLLPRPPPRSATA